MGNSQGKDHEAESISVYSGSSKEGWVLESAVGGEVCKEGCSKATLRR